MLKKERNLALHLRAAYLSMHRTANQRFNNSCGVTADQYVVLSLLMDHDGITQKEVKQKCFSDASTTGAVLRLLEKHKLITRLQSDTDGRARNVCLTNKGRELQKKSMAGG